MGRDETDIANGSQYSLQEYIEKWRDDTSLADKSDEFTYLTEVFGFEEVLCCLARTDWNPARRIGVIVPNISFFKHKKRKEKKLTIAAYYRCIANGGAQRVVAMLCNRWAGMKDVNGEYLFNVVLVTDVAKENDEYELSDKVIRAYVPAFANSEKENFRERYRAWASIIHDFKVDIVVHSLWASLVCYWDMLAIKGQPSKPAFVIHAHNFCAVPFGFTGNTAVVQMYKYMACDGVVTLSECDKTFVSSFNKHVAYIVNPIAFDPKSIPNTRHNEKTIIWVGRISEEKQPVDAIHMMNVVVKKIPDARLFLVGSGTESLQNTIVRLIHHYGLENNVEMAGFTLDVGRYYSRASVMVCTSRFEGFPLTIGEAMAYGVPVLAYDMPWLSFVQDGRGIITVPQGDYQALAQKTIEALSNQAQAGKIGEEGKKLITEIADSDIESEWKTFFDTIFLDTGNSNETSLDKAGILFKYLTLYQSEGRKKAVEKEIQKRKKLEKQIRSIKSEWSFKLGRAITWLPRKIKDVFRK